MNNIFLLILIIVIFLKFLEQNMITYDIIDNFLEDKIITNLKKYKIYLDKSNNLEEDNFKNTSSLVYYFNLSYLKKMSNNILFNTIKKILDKSPKKGNYFIANFLEVKPSTNSYSPEIHIDCTVCKFLDCSSKLLTPEIVGVVYLDIPECIEGGELVILGNFNQIRKYKPKNNRLLYFDGQYSHGVKGYSLDKCKVKKNRFSLVVEIYNLDLDLINNLPRIQIN
jgi:hypothetical protein